MLQQIRLSNYRNFVSLSLELKQSNVIIAPNGSGKSNLIEAIYYSNFAHSFRTIPSLLEQINDQSDDARVELSWEGEAVVAFSLSKLSKQRRFELGEKKQPVNKLIGRHNIVLFAPSCVNLVGEDPAQRRGDLDDYLSIFSSAYRKNLLSYNSTLRSRNVLLKMSASGRIVDTELKYFTDRLIKLGAHLVKVRSEFVAVMQPKIKEIAETIFGKEGFSIGYQPLINPENYEQEIEQKFNENSHKELAAGKTLYGIHRDDLLFAYQNSDLRYRGSRGQQRLASLIYKFAQLEHLSSVNKGPRLILLDDLMSELDEEHRTSCANYLLNGDFQYLLTAAEEKDVPRSLLRNGFANFNKIV